MWLPPNQPTLFLVFSPLEERGMNPQTAQNAPLLRSHLQRHLRRCRLRRSRRGQAAAEGEEGEASAEEPWRGRRSTPHSLRWKNGRGGFGNREAKIEAFKGKVPKVGLQRSRIMLLFEQCNGFRIVFFEHGLL